MPNGFRPLLLWVLMSCAVVAFTWIWVDAGPLVTAQLLTPAFDVAPDIHGSLHWWALFAAGVVAVAYIGLHRGER